MLRWPFIRRHVINVDEWRPLRRNVSASLQHSPSPRARPRNAWPRAPRREALMAKKSKKDKKKDKKSKKK
jgi:hypothetical protein